VNIRQALTIVVVLLFLFAGAASIFAQSMPFQPHPHHLGPPPLPAAVCADGKHLYVACGPKIFQYSIPDLKLIKTVELPKPAPPADK